MTAVMTAVATATAGVERLYAINKVPAAPQYPYGVYSAALGRGDTNRSDGTEGTRWGRITVQTFSKSDSALDLHEEVRAALVGTRLTVTGYDTTKVLAELDPAVTRDPDDTGVVGVTATFTFTATEE